jgi:phage tail sheath protein FI
MAFQVSPGVQVKEIDATAVVPAVSTSIGGTAGAFNWGPVGEVVSISSEKNLAEVFGTPDSGTFKYFLTAAGFLKYGNSLKVVRTDSTSMRNATADGTGLSIKNDSVYEASYSTGAGTVGLWAAKYSGIKGNSLKVAMCTESSSDSLFTGWTYASSFDSAPDTSNYASSLGKGSIGDELHLIVIDEDGDISGTAGTILETFAFMSQGSDAKKDDGTSNYYVDVINTGSNYIRWMDHHATLTEAGNAISTIASIASLSSATDNEVTGRSLSGGVDNSSPTAGEIALAFDLLEDAETVDVQLLFAYPDVNAANTISNDLIDIAAARKDCMAFVSPPIDDTVNAITPAADVKAWADTLTSSSYASADSTALYVYDKYNDTYRWIGAAGHVAGLCAATDKSADAWFSPAGATRGQLFGVTKLAFNPVKTDRDTLYKARVNPIVSFPGEGTLLFGDKTLLSKPSAFDRINVRRLFNTLEKAISIAARAQLFEFNDEFTRAQFRNLIEPFLRDVKGRRGITDFSVICDTTNNTGQVIDTNNFVADIYIKPARSINFITLNFIATRTGVDFSEISGS